ncbi:MAG TPA: UDP-3-O-acyl-N-acetylglucosamine deacetylase [Acetobacteraceae bacterium]|nr:UDP-3-O-acyl-N-acetylglucosamine deacetylase [Acetobacteraceae bacterium]
MDGLPQRLDLDTTATWQQQTLKSPIDCVGVGLHSGRRVRLTLRPAEPGHGIVFRRIDLNRDIPARFDRVTDGRLATVIGDGSARVGTIEHLMAALAGAGIDNALIELDGPEVPILDGSAAPLLFLLDCAGIVRQRAPRSAIEICRPVRVREGDAFAELRPAETRASLGACLDMSVSIDFPAAAIGRQSCSLRLSPASFRQQLAGARTFVLAAEVEQLRASGLALGGSLDNAVVVDGAQVLNPGGLRMENEFACHKLLDAVGDLALAGAPLHGCFIGHKSGHALNNRLLRALFADASAWREATAEPVTAAAA